MEVGKGKRLVQPSERRAGAREKRQQRWEEAVKLAEQRPVIGSRYYDALMYFLQDPDHYLHYTKFDKKPNSISSKEIRADNFFIMRKLKAINDDVLEKRRKADLQDAVGL